MLKVFLVEDEVVMRNGIKKLIPWEQEGLEFVGEASDGELAYPMIKKEKPDILITDIRMPFMDGLELSRLVKKELPQIKIIILSGFGEFDYAKEAISIGVTDYLLKPISPAKFLEAVKKVASAIEAERENDRILLQYQKEMQENIQLEKNRLWTSLTSNRNALSAAELLESADRLGIDFAGSAFLVFLYKIMSPADEGKENWQRVNHASEEIIAMADGSMNVTAFDRSPEGLAFLIKGNSPEEAEETLRNGINTIRGVLAGYPELSYFGGVGKVVGRLRDIRLSYLDAAKAFSGRFFTKESRIIKAEDIVKIHQNEGHTASIDVSKIQSQTQDQELVKAFLKKGTREETEGFVEEYFHNVGEQNYRSVIFRQYICMNLYFIVSDFLGSMDLGMDKLPPECQDVNEIVAAVGSVEVMKERICSLLIEAQNLRDKNSMKKNGVLLEEAKQFILDNYQKEEMSLQAVAAQVNISPSYFSSIFSNETGQTFIEYLTQVRLDKAKELLLCTSMRTAEIAYEVGYRDSHYFSYIFKKVVGCTPKEYKSRR